MPSFEKIQPPRIDPTIPIARFPRHPKPAPLLTSPAIHPASSPMMIHPSKEELTEIPKK
jgi:hypothetical protein